MNYVDNPCRVLHQGTTNRSVTGERLKVQGHLTKFKKYGKGGQYIATFYHGPQKWRMILRLFVHGRRADQSRPCHTFMNTGTISGRPSMGSWVNYGLGSEAETSRASSCQCRWMTHGPPYWSPGFLPSVFRVWSLIPDDPVHYVSNQRSKCGS